MRQMDLDYIIIAVLFLSGFYVATTGLLMGLFGSPQFFWHSYTGYLSATLAGIHLLLNWGRVTTYLRRRFKRRSGWATPVRREVTPGLGRRGFLAMILAAIGGFVLGWLRPGGRMVARLDETGGQYGDLGQLYHRWSKPGSGLIPGLLLSWGGQPARYKTYPSPQRVILPDPDDLPGLRLDEAIEQRRSRRHYSTEPLTLTELSRLLHAASGITAPGQGLRAAPSAGALYPIETYVVVHNVVNLEPGLYHYAVAEHALEQLRNENLSTEMVVAGIGQEMLGQASVCFILSAIFQRTRWKYRERSYRYILLETGHIGQNLYLAATSMGLGACAVGAFLDDNLNNLLGVDGEEEAALYIISVGKV